MKKNAYSSPVSRYMKFGGNPELLRAPLSNIGMPLIGFKQGGHVNQWRDELLHAPMSNTGMPVMGLFQQGGMVRENLLRAPLSNIGQPLIGFKYGGMPCEHGGNCYEEGGMVDEYRDGGIHIAKNKRGTFTAAATKHGKGVQEFASQVLANKENYSPAMVKKANFARNFGGKHQYGGPGNPYAVSDVRYPEQIDAPVPMNETEMGRYRRMVDPSKFSTFRQSLYNTNSASDFFGTVPDTHGPYYGEPVQPISKKDNFQYRKDLAERQYGIPNYRGTAAQNMELLNRGKNTLNNQWGDWEGHSKTDGHIRINQYGGPAEYAIGGNFGPNGLPIEDDYDPGIIGKPPPPKKYPTDTGVVQQRPPAPWMKKADGTYMDNTQATANINYGKGSVGAYDPNTGNTAPRPQYPWMQAIGDAATQTIGAGMAIGSQINSMNNMRDVHRQSQQMGLTGMQGFQNPNGTKGDYTPNTHMFRPQDMTPASTGMYYPSYGQYGGRMQHGGQYWDGSSYQRYNQASPNGLMEYGGQYENGGEYEIDDDVYEDLIRKGYKLQRM